MFVRVKGTGQYRYLQVVENHREGKRTLQRVICTLGKGGRACGQRRHRQPATLPLSLRAARVRLMEAGDLEKGLKIERDVVRRDLEALEQARAREG